MKIAFPILLAGCLLTPGMSLADSFDCKLEMRRAGGYWMGPELQVQYDKAAGTARLSDRVIQKFSGPSTDAFEIIDNDKRVTFRYRLKLVPGTGSNSHGPVYGDHIYSLTILKPSLKAIVQMKPMGFSNTFRDQGKCIRK